MKLWWISDFARVRTEREAIHALAANDPWFTLFDWRINEGRLSVEGALTAHSIPYPVRLIYPDQFPLVPAWVEPLDPTARWTTHQYGKGGSLCLELRPDNWIPSATGADMLRSAYHLLRTEDPLGNGGHGVVEAGHHISDAQSYDWGPEPVLINAGCLERIRAGSAQNVRALRWPIEDKVWPILVFDDADCTQPQHPPSFDFATLRFEVPVVVVRTSQPKSALSDRATFTETLNICLDPDLNKGSLVVVVVGESDVTPYHSLDADSVFRRKWVVLSDQLGVRSGRASGAASRSVAIVGLGSVGSKIAETLLRSGVTDLVLVDGDVFLPANIERHTLDWRDVGFRKANAIRRRLLHIAPGSKIEVLPVNLNWQTSAKTHAKYVDQLAECDVIIDTTGDSSTGLFLGAIAAENDKPFVSVEVFEGGLGCVVARSLPGRDPPYAKGRASYLAYCDQTNVAPPPSGKGRYESLSDAGTPLVADDAAVSIAAGHAGRVALDILDGRVDAEDKAWLLIGFRRGWLFRGHGDTICLDVGAAPQSPVPVEDADTRAFVVALAEEALDATTSPA